MWLPLKRPLLGTWPAAQARALTGNQTSNPLVFSLVLNPLGRLSLPSGLTVHFSSPEAWDEAFLLGALVKRWVCGGRECQLEWEQEVRAEPPGVAQSVPTLCMVLAFWADLG